VPLSTIRHLIAKYAEVAADIIRLTANRPELRDTLTSDVATIGAEVVHAIAHEHAVHLSDIVIRRTGLGSMDSPDDTALRAAAAIAAAQLGWDDARSQAEIDSVREFYHLEK
jgi:glycerol-3-phosphate dehydrogenase